MTYLEMEETGQDADPMHLLMFERTEGTYRYAISSIDLTIDGVTWVASGFGMSELVLTDELMKAVLSFKFPLEHSFSQLFLADQQEQRTSATLFRLYLSDPDQEVVAYWKGRVTSAKPNGEVMSIECEPIFTSLRRPGLRARYQKTCRHAVYSLRCGLNREDFAEVLTCTVAAGRNYTVTGADAFADDYFTGGIMKSPDGTTKHIIGHIGTLIKTTHIAESLIDDVAINGLATVTLYPGCNKLTTTCKNKFNNLLNNGSFPYIPAKNPIGGTSSII